MRRMYSKPQLLEAVESESKINGIKVFEDIKDKNGNPRFIEGDITFNTIEGLTQAYGKWSLSGSHLMIVVAGNVANGTTLVDEICNFELPNWIFDKIVTIYGNIVAQQTLLSFSTGGATQTNYIYLSKQTTKLRLLVSSLTYNAERFFRAQFDLLIDNE